MEQWRINSFQNRLLDHVTPRYGKSHFELSGGSPWPGELVRALMHVKTSHFFERPWRRLGRRPDTMSASDRIASLQPEINATRQGWVKKLLGGITHHLHLHSIPVVSEPPEGTNSWDVQALFPDEDIEEVRLACQDYPVLQDTLEEFLDDVLELRGNAEGGDDG